MTANHMTGKQYEAALEALGLNAYSARKLLGVQASTSYRYRAGKGPIPKPIAALLATMIAHSLKPDQVESYLHDFKRRKP